MPDLHALCCGRLRFDRSVFFPGEAPGALATVPVPAWLVRHPKGILLFDTGIECAAAADPVGVLGKGISSTFAMAGAAHENPVDQLALLGLRPEDITHVVNSHLHFDHCGCNALFTRARFLVQRAEMVAARAAPRVYPARAWDHALDYQLIEGEHDVFGDGTVLLLPTPGHTPGHQSMRVQVARDACFIATADACYSEEHLQRDLLPGAVWQADTMRESMQRLRRWGEQAGTTLLFGHDAAQFARLGPAHKPLL